MSLTSQKNNNLASAISEMKLALIEMKMPVDRAVSGEKLSSILNKLYLRSLLDIQERYQV